MPFFRQRLKRFGQYFESRYADGHLSGFGSEHAALDPYYIADIEKREIVEQFRPDIVPTEIDLYSAGPVLQMSKQGFTVTAPADDSSGDTNFPSGFFQGIEIRYHIRGKVSPLEPEGKRIDILLS